MRGPDAVPEAGPQRQVTIVDLLCWVCSLFVQLSLHNIISPVYEVEVWSWSVWSFMWFKPQKLVSKKRFQHIFSWCYSRISKFCQNWRWQLFCHLPPPICANLHFYHWRRLKRNTAQGSSLKNMDFLWDQHLLESLSHDSNYYVNISNNNHLIKGKLIFCFQSLV